MGVEAEPAEPEAPAAPECRAYPVSDQNRESKCQIWLIDMKAYGLTLKMRWEREVAIVGFTPDVPTAVLVLLIRITIHGTKCGRNYWLGGIELVERVWGFRRDSTGTGLSPTYLPALIYVLAP